MGIIKNNERVDANWSALFIIKTELGNGNRLIDESVPYRMFRDLIKFEQHKS